jgi:hypothetical protein
MTDSILIPQGSLLARIIAAKQKTLTEGSLIARITAAKQKTLTEKPPSPYSRPCKLTFRSPAMHDQKL